LSYNLLMKQLGKLERELVKQDPDNWSPFFHCGPFPNMHPILDWGKGGNWKKSVEWEDTTFRKTVQFLYEKKDETRIYKVVMEAKRLGLEKKITCQHSFWQIIPKKPNESQRAGMDDYIFNHGAVQKGKGNINMWGLRNPDYVVEVKLEPGFDEEGNEVPRPSPGDCSVRALLCNIWMDEEQVIQSILPGYDGSTRGFFLNSPALEDMAMIIGVDPASFIKIYALRRDGLSTALLV